MKNSQKLLKCEVCCRVFKTNSYLKIIMNKNNCRKTLECDVCPQVMKNFQAFQAHKKLYCQTFVPNLSPGLNVESVGTVLKMPSDCRMIRKVTSQNQIFVLFAPSVGNFVLVQLSSSCICTLIQELNLISVEYVA